jgi:hypothetical protein
MGRTKSTVFAAFAGVMLTAAALAAQGIPSDRSTFVTVSGPVSLPGVTLPAGTYLFRLADSLSTRNVVQIFDKDRTKIFATIIAVSAERMEPSGEAVITFKETPSDRPPAVHYWYYAGEKSGQEFVYPKEQAMQIAAASGESVLAADTADMEAMKTAEISRVEPGAATHAEHAETSAAAQTAQQPALPNEQSSASTQPQQSQPEATTPQSAPTTTQSETTRPETQPSAESTPPAASATTRDTATAPMTSQQTPRATGTSGRSELPRTASQEPLVALAGFLAMTAALSLHAFRKVASARISRR